MKFRFTSKVGNFNIMKLKAHELKIYPRAWQFHKGDQNLMQPCKFVIRLAICKGVSQHELLLNDTYKDSH
jgi:hypothetical protein